MSMHRLSTLAAALLAALVLSACGDFPGAPLAARDTIDETRPSPLMAASSWRTSTVDITLRTWSRDEVRIEAERAAVNEEMLEKIEIEIEGEGSAVRVKTRYPKQKGWFMGGNRGKVDYEITVPRGAEVRLKTVNGPVDVEGLSGDLQVESVNGGLDLDDVGGEVRAKTVNGGIHADFDRVPGSGHHRFETVNGGIEVALPEDAGGRLEATTVNGWIDCDLPLDVTAKKKRRLEGRFGSGDGRFDLDTVNGGIDVVAGLGRPRRGLAAAARRVLSGLPSAAAA